MLKKQSRGLVVEVARPWDIGSREEEGEELPLINPPKSLDSRKNGNSFLAQKISQKLLRSNL